MKTLNISLFTLSPLHIGCGQSVGVVDMPVLRERATGLPTVPGSTLKGVLADLFLDNNKRNEAGTELFGSEDTTNASRGALMIGDVQLLAFPVRSAKMGFVWATSPLLLARQGIDCPHTPGDEEAYGAKAACIGDAFVLEEYPLTRRADNISDTIYDALLTKCDHPLWTNTVKDRLVIISDTLMSYFAQNACEIANHNKVDDETGIVANHLLFSQENVPSETIFVGKIQSRDADKLDMLKKAIEAEENCLQIGANATTGLGWCQVTVR